MILRLLFHVLPLESDLGREVWAEFLFQFMVDFGLGLFFREFGDLKKGATVGLARLGEFLAERGDLVLGSAQLCASMFEFLYFLVENPFFLFKASLLLFKLRRELACLDFCLAQNFFCRRACFRFVRAKLGEALLMLRNGIAEIVGNGFPPPREREACGDAAAGTEEADDEEDEGHRERWYWRWYFGSGRS